MVTGVQTCALPISAFQIEEQSDVARSVHDLRTPSPPIGCLPEAQFSQRVVRLGRNATLLIFSAGAYEFQEAAGIPITLADYRRWLVKQVSVAPLRLADCEQFAQTYNRGADLEDDLSILCVRF